MNIANRIQNLGTETAFAVSLDAKNHKDDGNKVYPFHLGDLNFSTPENITEAACRALRDGKTGYNPPAGIIPFRSTVADYVSKTRGVKYSLENVVVQPGGKPTIGKFLNAIMNPGDGVFYPNPGYPIYESQIEYLGGKSLPYGYILTKNGYMINREMVESQIDNDTRIFIYNNYQNPMGAESNENEMQWVADLAIKYNLFVLSDEAYYGIRYSGKSRSIVSLDGMKERTVILFTFSKSYAMTGWRLGASIGPEPIINVIEKLNVNDESCTNHFIQYAGIEALTGDQSGSEMIVRSLKKRQKILFEELSKIKGLKVFNSNTTFYSFPDITEIYIKKKFNSLEEFRLKTLKETGVSFCTREHFGRSLLGEDIKHIRFAYSGISASDIKQGINELRDYWSY